MKKGREHKKTQTLMMAFIAFIMITSILGFTWKGGTTKVEYNGFPIIQEEVGWSLEVNNQNLFFEYHPSELEYLNVSPAIMQRLATLEVDTTYDIDDDYAEYIAKAQYDLETSLRGFDIFIVKGFTAENEFDKPVITCKSATPYVPVVYFKKSNQTQVTMEGDCIIAEVLRGEEFTKIKDLMIYSILGVMK